MSAIITNELRIKTANLFQRSLDEAPCYAFIGKTSEWDDEFIPDDVTDSTLNRQDIYTEMLGLKRITSSNIKSVIPRYDWISGNIYDEYDDDVDLIDSKNPITDNFYQFYVLTDNFNIYKCLYNNNRAKSIVKPTGVNPDPFNTPDGYIWKYMATVTTTDAFNFMTRAWIPLTTIYSDDASNQWVSQQSSINGSIDIIKVTDGGAGYTSIPTVTITGDGTSCTGIAIVDILTETVKEIVVSNRGTNYTNAVVSIVGGDGVGATAKAVISPRGGHGSDPRTELGGTYTLVRVPLDGSEGGIIPIDITYRQTGIISNIRSTSIGSIIKCPDISLFLLNESVEGQTSGATGVIQSIDVDKKWLYLTDVIGSFIQGEDIVSNIYGITTIVSEYVANENLLLLSSVADKNDIVENTGDILYIANRTKVVRGENQTEEIKFVISF